MEDKEKKALPEKKVEKEAKSNSSRHTVADMCVVRSTVLCDFDN